MLQKIIWTHEALVQLTEIEDYISKASPERAAKFIDQLIGRAEAVLSDKPRAGRTVPEIANPDIRELIFKNYRIVYRLNENNVEILTVFEGHRLLQIGDLEISFCL
ncbi:MAG: type II toxin-antitoxin system RelE/ParE family toxin [Actinobacteria bacterium]|nr:type II toxin-antitoxin system RelE/ParE family toxin [Actinomycetota bacterium]